MLEVIGEELGFLPDFSVVDLAGFIDEALQKLIPKGVIVRLVEGKGGSFQDAAEERGGDKNFKAAPERQGASRKDQSARGHGALKSDSVAA